MVSALEGPRGPELLAVVEGRKGEMRKAAGRFKGLLAGKKFILLSRQTHLRGKARQALQQLLSANRRLLKAHLLKESFGYLWSYRSKTWARKFFRCWTSQLKWSRLTPYQRFARMIDRHLDGILSYCDKKLPLFATLNRPILKPQISFAEPTATDIRNI